LAKLTTNKTNMVKLTNELIFSSKTNYAKIIAKINMNEVLMAKIKMVKLVMVKLTIRWINLVKLTTNKIDMV